MGYYTHFDVTMTGPDNDLKDLADYIDIAWEDLEFDYSKPGNFNTHAKWYDWEEDFIMLSLTWPTVEFLITGEGEQSPDFWKALVLNGRLQIKDAEIFFPPFESWEAYVGN